MNIVHLPVELLVQIFDCLPQSALIHNLSLVHKSWYDLVQHSPDVWRTRTVLFENSVYTHDNEPWRHALRLVRNCSLKHVHFSFLPLIDLLSLFAECAEHLTSLTVEQCQNQVISEYVLMRLYGMTWPELEQMQIGNFYVDGASAIRQLFKYVLPNSPKLQYLNGFEVPLLSYGSEVNWEGLKSITLMNDAFVTASSSEMLVTVAQKLENLTHLDLRATGFEFDALNTLFQHTTSLERLSVQDLYTFDVTHGFDGLKELSVTRSERVVQSIIKKCCNIESLKLDIHASFEIKEVAKYLKNLRHLWIERYSDSLIEIMKNCSLHTLRIGRITHTKENKLIENLIEHGQSIRVLVLDQVQFSNSADIYTIMKGLPNLKELTANACFTHSSPIDNISTNTHGLETFKFEHSRMQVNVHSFATANLRNLTYIKAKREATQGIRPEDFNYIAAHSPHLKKLDVSLFDIPSQPTNSSKKPRLNIFTGLDTAHLIFGEYGSLSQMCGVLICCQNASTFSVDSIFSKAQYVDKLRAFLEEEKVKEAMKRDKEKHKTARSDSTNIAAKKQHKKWSTQRYTRVKKSHKRTDPCTLQKLASIVWKEIDQLLNTTCFYDNGKNATEMLRKTYKNMLVTKFNPEDSRKTSIIHEFLHLLRLRILTPDIPKRILLQR